MPIAKKRHTIYPLAILFLLIRTLFPPQAQARQIPAQDVVILIDSSESASPYLDSIVGILGRFVGGADYGDSFICYQFSNNPILIAQKKIRKPGDVGHLRSQLRQLRAAGESTNYSPALKKALKDIRDSYTERPANERILILITDGRRHKGNAGKEDIAFRQLLRSSSDLKVDTDYFFYCFYIGDWLEDDLRLYLNAVGAQTGLWPDNPKQLDKLSLADVYIVEKTIHLSEPSGTPPPGTFSISFHTRRPPESPGSMDVSLEAEFGEETLDRFFSINPARIFCQPEPWTETFGFEMRGFTRGSYSGSIVFRPSTPQTLLLSPRTVGLYFDVAEPLLIMVPEPLNFGPTGFRGEYTETKRISVLPSRADFPGSAGFVSAIAEIDLPEGLKLDVSPALKKKELVLNVTVSRHQTLNRQFRGEYKGKIKLIPKAGWALADNEIPFTVMVAGKEINYRAIGRYIGITLAVVLGVLFVLFISRRARTKIMDYFANKTSPVGKLILTRDPTKGLARNINIARLSEKKRHREISVGVGREVDVELPHRSMIDMRYSFWGLKAKNVVHTIVEAREGTDAVLVNDISRTGMVQLAHFDAVKIGAFEFRYETPKPLQQAVIYFLDGQVKQGWLLSWNTDSEGFHFLSRDDLPQRKEVFVRFYELKAAAFVRDFEGELTKRLLAQEMPRSGHLARIIFADGEELTGYVTDLKNLEEKFYLFPDALGDNVMFFLIEKTTVKDIVLIKDDDAGAERAKRQLAELLEQLKAAIGGGLLGGP